MNPDCPLKPNHRRRSGALAAIFDRIRAGGGAPCTNIPTGMKAQDQLRELLAGKLTDKQ
jgi:hypothetical protein